jgi:single-strand DNA-binding protein
MANINRIVLIGKIIDTPDIKVSTDGKSIANFSIEVERSFGDKKDIMPIVCWEKLADSASNYSKGQFVLVEGRIQQKTYEDSEGKTIWTTDIVASLLKNFNSNIDAENTNTDKKEEITEDDIPF